MTDASDRRPVVVVGVLPEEPLWVLQVAGDFARQFGARLVCVTVDGTRYSFQELPDGTMLSSPLPADQYASGPLFPPERLHEVAALLDPMGIEWSMRQLVGEPSNALIEVADELNAILIVVGARPAGFATAVRNFFTGSVALRLAHHQYRPVVVVPVEPTEAGERLPGEADAATG